MPQKNIKKVENVINLMNICFEYNFCVQILQAANVFDDLKSRF